MFNFHCNLYFFLIKLLNSSCDEDTTSGSPCWFPKGLFETPQNYSSVPPLSDMSSASSLSEDEQSTLCSKTHWLVAVGRNLDVEDFISLDETKQTLDLETSSYWGSSNGSEVTH